jgi:hypothetical protein
MIYFVQETGLFRNRVKIGFTDNVKGRMSGLRGGSPSTLKLLMILPGDTQIEVSYHERFRKYRLHGEWFRFGFRLRLFVWMNQFKPFVLDELKRETGTERSEIKPETFFPTDEETRIIETFVSLWNGSEKFSWRKATEVIFGKDKFGKSYNNKLKHILDKFNINYTTSQNSPEDRAEIIRQLYAEGKNNQEIAEFFGEPSCNGQFYYEIQSALQKTLFEETFNE